MIPPEALAAMRAVIEAEIDKLIQGERDPVPHAWLCANRKTLVELCLARSEAASLKALICREAAAAAKH